MWPERQDDISQDACVLGVILFNKKDNEPHVLIIARILCGPWFSELRTCLKPGFSRLHLLFMWGSPISHFLLSTFILQGIWMKIPSLLYKLDMSRFIASDYKTNSSSKTHKANLLGTKYQTLGSPEDEPSLAWAGSSSIPSSVAKGSIYDGYK